MYKSNLFDKNSLHNQKRFYKDINKKSDLDLKSSSYYNNHYFHQNLTFKYPIKQYPNANKLNPQPKKKWEQYSKQNYINLFNKPNYQQRKIVSQYQYPTLRQQVQILSQNQFVEGKIKKRLVSKALKGLALSKASTKQRFQIARQKAQIVNFSNMLPFPDKLQPCRISNKPNGVIEYYAANTSQGIVRNYNEDRISIILNIIKPQSRKQQNWPQCSFFGIFDGHGGSSCSDFLRDNLHQFVIKHSQFPWNPKKALIEGFKQAQEIFLQMCQSIQGFQKSGSCAIVCLIIGKMCYIANVGDSRAVLSLKQGKQILQLSRDHKPLDEQQQKRIRRAGGRIFQTQCYIQYLQENNDPEIIIGPLRVFPGRLSVSRTFGDIQAKKKKYGGMPGVIVSQPQITYFELNRDHDFIFMASDGIFDKMESEQVIKKAWSIKNYKNLNEFAGIAVDQIMKQSLLRKSADNISAVLIGFNKIGQISQKKTQEKLAYQRCRTATFFR